MALAAPLSFGAVQTWAWTALLVGAMVLAIMWAVSCVNERSICLYWSPLYIPATLFLGLGALQYFGHHTLDSLATRESLLLLLTQLIYFFLAGQIVSRNSGKGLPRFGLVVLIYAFLLSLFAIIQFYTGDGLIYWSIKPRWDSAIFGPYVNHNHYAGLLQILIPVGAAYALSRPPGHSGKILSGFAVLVTIASLMLAGSRGGLISILAEGLILILIILRASPAPTRRPIVLTLVAGFIFVDLFFYWLAPNLLVKRLETTTTFLKSPEVTLGDRLRVSKDSLRVFWSHPWLGTGLGSFEPVFPQYRTFPSDLEWAHAHNDYVEALAETGLAGGTLILLALWLGLRAVFRDLGERLTSEAGWVQTGAAIGCCGLLVHSFVDFNLHIPANAMWFAICVGISTSSCTVERPRLS
jgi:O-antigen ligase